MKIAIAGAGTYGLVYHHYLRESGQFDVVGFLDDDPGKIGQMFSGVSVLCETRNYAQLKESGIDGVVCPIGNNLTRRQLLKDYQANGFETPGFIHKSVIIPGDVHLGQGVYILPGSIVMPFAELHDFVMISMGVKVAHHTILREASFLSTGVNMGANIDFGVCAFAGIGSTITTGVKKIGAYATIGAGAVIIRDVEDHSVVVGNPGRVIKK